MLEDMDLIPFEQETDKIALIDADSALYYCMGEATFEAAKIKLDMFMFNLLGICETPHYAAFITPHRTFRNDVGFTKPYKGNRSGKNTPPMFYGLKAYARDEWGFYEVEGLEADDCVALYRSANSVICSPDKDVILQVPGVHYNYFKNEWIDTSRADAWRFLWTQCAAGDSVDFIPGIPGIGMVKAGKALDEVSQEDYPLRILQMYIELSGCKIKESVDKYKEALDLVYILKEKVDTEKYGITLPDLKKFDIREVYTNGISTSSN